MDTTTQAIMVLWGLGGWLCFAFLFLLNCMKKFDAREVQRREHEAIMYDTYI